MKEFESRTSEWYEINAKNMIDGIKKNYEMAIQDYQNYIRLYLKKILEFQRTYIYYVEQET